MGPGGTSRVSVFSHLDPLGLRSSSSNKPYRHDIGALHGMNPEKETWLYRRDRVLLVPLEQLALQDWSTWAQQPDPGHTQVTPDQGPLQPPWATATTR